MSLFVSKGNKIVFTKKKKFLKNKLEVKIFRNFSEENASSDEIKMVIRNSKTYLMKTVLAFVKYKDKFYQIRLKEKIPRTPL